MMQVKNETSLDLIPRSVKAAIDEVDLLFHDIFGDDLYAVYLEGSAARGDYVAGVSDLDFRALTNREPVDEDWQKLSQGIERITKEFKIEKIDPPVFSVESVNQRPRTQFIITKDGLLISGRAYVPTVEFPPIGPELAKFLEAPIVNRIKGAHERLEKLRHGEKLDVVFWSRSTAKHCMRLALGIAMTRQPVYTPKMKDMPRIIKPLVPEISDDINVLNRAYLNPSDSLADYEKLVSACDHILDIAKSVGVVENN